MVNTETRVLSGSKVALADLGYKSINASIGVSYYDFPVRAKRLAQYFHQTDKELIAGSPGVRVLIHWYLYDDKRMLALCEKLPIKDENGNVVAILAHTIDITHSNLIDISRYLNLFSHNRHAQENDGQFFYKICQSNDYTQDNLSAREVECLFYILRGKTAKEVAKILCLSCRTVESHIDNMKYKFGVTRKTQLIEKAIMKGYINVLPKSLLANSS